MIDGTFTRDGTSLHFRGEGEGSPVVLVHGVGGSLNNWNKVAETLCDSYRVIRLDLRGHGQSSKEHKSYSLGAFVADIVGLADELGIDSFHLVGHSLGGMIAQHAAIHYPERIRSACIISSAAGRTAEEATAVQARIDILRHGNPGEHFRKSVARWYSPEFVAANESLLADLERQNRENDPWCYSEAYAVLAYAELGPELHKIKVPTLVATGEFDMGSNPRMARFMHDEIPGSELHIFEGLRHSILVEAPDRVLDVVTRFLKKNDRVMPTHKRSGKQTIGGRIPTPNGFLSASRAVRAGDLVYVSGTLPRKGSQVMTDGTIEEQTRAALSGLTEILGEAGCSLKDVVKVTVHLRERSDFPGFDKVFSEFFPEEPPARCGLHNQLLVDARLNLEVIAYAPESR